MYTLTWKVDKTIPTACPDYVPDPYTGEYPSFHCAVYHCMTITENKSAEFATQDEALQFAAKAPQSCYEFKLNGELIEDTRPRPQNITEISVGGDFTTTANGTTTLSP